MERRIELIDYLSVFIRWWRFIVYGTVLIATGALLLTFTMTRYYTTDAKVLVSRAKTAERVHESWRTFTEIESLTSVIHNNAILLDAMEEFKLKESSWDMSLEKIQKLLAVYLVRKTDLMSVTFAFPDRELAPKILAYILEAAVARNRALNRAEEVESRKFIGQELEEARKERDAIQTELREYRRQFDSEFLEGLRDAVLDNIQKLGEHRGKVKGEVAEGIAAVAEGEVRLSKIAQKVKLQSVLSEDATYQQLIARLADQSLVALLGEPFVKEEVSLAHERVLAEVTARAVKLAGDREELAELDNLLSVLNARAENWNGEMAVREETIKDLQDRYEVANKVYEGLALHYNEATVRVSSRSQDLRIVDPPFLPEKPSWPRRGLVLIVITQLSLIVLSGLSFFLDYLQRRKQVV